MQKFGRDFRRFAYCALLLVLLYQAILPVVFSADVLPSKQPADAFEPIVIQPRVVVRANTGTAVPPAPQPMAFVQNFQSSAAEGADYKEVDNDLPIIVPQPVHRPTYSQVYKSIPFIRSEYMANPSYRHDATMEIMFGKLRPMSINRYYYGRTPLYRDGFRYGRTHSSARPRYPRSYFYYPRPILYRNY